MMTFYTLQVVIEKEPGDEEYAAYSPNLPGCFSRGRTIEEARQAIRASLSVRLRELAACGEPLPATRKFLRVEDLTIGLAGPDRNDAPVGEKKGSSGKPTSNAPRARRPRSRSAPRE